MILPHMPLAGYTLLLITFLEGELNPQEVGRVSPSPLTGSCDSRHLFNNQRPETLKEGSSENDIVLLMSAPNSGREVHTYTTLGTSLKRLMISGASWWKGQFID